MCSHLCPYSAIRTSSLLFSLPVTVLLPGCFWAQDTLRGCSMAKDSSCLPFVSILVSLSVPNLSPYFSISIAIILSGCFRSKESPCLPFLTSLSIAQCSSFWWLWGQDSSPICFRTLSWVTLGASGHSVLVPLVLSNSCPYFSLSLSLCLSLGAWERTDFLDGTGFFFLIVLLCLGFCSPLFSSSWVLLGTGYSSWLLDGEGFFLPPICFHTCLLVCSQLVSLFLYLHCDSSLWVLSVKGISLSPVPHFSLHCSVFFVLVALGTGLKSHLFSYSSLYFTLTCGCSLWVLPGHSMLLVLCLSPCLSPLFSPTHALTFSLSLSLSLAVLLSRCLFGHMILSGSPFVPPCPRLFPPTCILNSLLIAAAAWERTDFLASCVSP